MYIVYKITNLINGKIYIGQSNNKRKNYLGSGKNIKIALKLFGRKNFSKQILITCSSIKEATEYEALFIELYDSINPEIGYNILEKVKGTNGFKKGEQSEKLKGNKNPMYGKSSDKSPVAKAVEAYDFFTSKSLENMRFNTTKEAADYLKCSPSIITCVIRGIGKAKTAKGYYFRYVNPEHGGVGHRKIKQKHETT